MGWRVSNAKRRRLRCAWGVVCLVLTTSTVWGHIGSPNVFLEGQAGPYPVRVTIQPPGVVPGIADIFVRVSAATVEAVTVQPVLHDTGQAEAPPPDLATPVGSDPQLYRAELWLEREGSYRVHVGVSGPAGAGEVIVPLLSLATRFSDMPPEIGILLAGLGGVLFVAALSILGAAVRESVLPPGATPKPPPDESPDACRARTPSPEAEKYMPSSQRGRSTSISASARPGSWKYSM